MKLILETSLDDLYLALVNENDKIIKSITVQSLVKKTDALFDEINRLFENTNFSINDLKSIYITLGPGSFSGARIGLLFARTMVQISNTKMYVCYTYELFKKQLELKQKWENFVLIKANKHSQYHIDFSDGAITTTLVENEDNYFCFDYAHFESSIAEYLTVFKEARNPIEVELAYLHEPQIGRQK